MKLEQLIKAFEHDLRLGRQDEASAHEIRVEWEKRREHDVRPVMVGISQPTTRARKAWLGDLCGMSLLAWVMSFHDVRLTDVKEASDIIERFKGRRLILLGKEVAAALGYGETPYFEWVSDQRGVHVSVIPHPSGANRIRWQGDQKSRAKKFLLNARKERAHGQDGNPQRLDLQNVVGSAGLRASRQGTAPVV